MSQGGRAPGSANRVVELFAGVGGFHVALREAGWDVIWANQWEPSTKTQHAADCYRAHFGSNILVNEDINSLVPRPSARARLLVGGFPCQDYSVAKTLSQAAGIEGKKGVLWWAIHRSSERRPRYVFLENVDRLLKSPATQRGRDFAIILACLSDLGYLVEWRVVNAADYGFPQRRRRVFIVAEHLGDLQPAWVSPLQWLYEEGVLARALKVWPSDDVDIHLEIARTWSSASIPSQITHASAGATRRRRSRTPASCGIAASGPGGRAELRREAQMLGELLVPDDEVPE